MTYGAWPWSWPADLLDALVPSRPRLDAPKPAPKPPQPEPRRWKLVDALADGASLSKTKARWEITRGCVLVDGQVETDADRMLSSDAEVEWISGGT